MTKAQLLQALIGVPDNVDLVTTEGGDVRSLMYMPDARVLMFSPSNLRHSVPGACVLVNEDGQVSCPCDCTEAARAKQAAQEERSRAVETLRRGRAEDQAAWDRLMTRIDARNAEDCA